jgi:hypothetical protein
MRPFSLGVTTLVQGVYALLWVVVLLDVASPTFDLRGFPDWTGVQAGVAAVVLFTASVALGVVMHTVSRRLFHHLKESWALTVLSSAAVRRRFASLESVETVPGGLKYKDILNDETADRVRQAGEFLHALEYQLMTRALDVYQTIQVYRDQYRLARGFILPSAAFAIVLPLWDPVRALDGAGFIGPFPIIRTQLFLLSVLAAAVSYVAFRERSYRYAAAKALAFATLEGLRAKNRKP